MGWHGGCGLRRRDLKKPESAAHADEESGSNAGENGDESTQSAPLEDKGSKSEQPVVEIETETEKSIGADDQLSEGLPDKIVGAHVATANKTQ